MNEIPAFILNLLKFLLPPKIHDNGDKDLIYKTQIYELRKKQWEYRIGWTVLFLVLSTFLICGLSWGWTPWYTGFELRAEAQTINSGLSNKLNLILENALEEQIRSKLQIRCNTSDRAFKSELYYEINGPNGLERQYYDMTGRGYRQPDCSELQ